MKDQKKALVACASRYGSTAGIAEAIADTLRQKGVDAEAIPARQVAGLSSYSAILPEGPVIARRWMSDALDFVQRHGESLKGLPVAYFTVGVMPPEKGEE